MNENISTLCIMNLCLATQKVEKLIRNLLWPYLKIVNSKNSSFMTKTQFILNTVVTDLVNTLIKINHNRAKHCRVLTFQNNVHIMNLL